MTCTIDITTLLAIHKILIHHLEGQYEINAEVDGSNDSTIEELELLLEDIHHKIFKKSFKHSLGGWFKRDK